jgi:phage FluMu protein Com
MSNKNSFSIITEEECIICFDPLKNENISILNCLHKFHTKCIKKWFNTQTKNHIEKSCPLCKTGNTMITDIIIENNDLEYNDQQINHTVCCEIV